MLTALRTRAHEALKDVYFVSTPVPMAANLLKEWPKEWATPWWRDMPEDELNTVMTEVMQSPSVEWIKVGEAEAFPIDPEFQRHIGHVAELAAEASGQYVPTTHPTIMKDVNPFKFWWHKMRWRWF